MSEFVISFDGHATEEKAEAMLSHAGVPATISGRVLRCAECTWARNPEPQKDGGVMYKCRFWDPWDEEGRISVDGDEFCSFALRPKTPTTPYQTSRGR